MKKFIILLLISCLFRYDLIPVPAERLWNKEIATYDTEQDEFRDYVLRYEGWCGGMGKDDSHSCYWAHIRIPAKRKLIISVRLDLFNEKLRNNPDTVALLGAALPFRRRFVLINVEQTKSYERQYKVWPHLGILSVGTVAYEEGGEVILWDELVQGQADLERLVEPWPKSGCYRHGARY